MPTKGGFTLQPATNNQYQQANQYKTSSTTNASSSTYNTQNQQQQHQQQHQKQQQQRQQQQQQQQQHQKQQQQNQRRQLKRATSFNSENAVSNNSSKTRYTRDPPERSHSINQADRSTTTATTLTLQSGATRRSVQDIDFMCQNNKENGVVNRGYLGQSTSFYNSIGQEPTATNEEEILNRFRNNNNNHTTIEMDYLADIPLDSSKLTRSNTNNTNNREIRNDKNSTRVIAKANSGYDDIKNISNSGNNNTATRDVTSDGKGRGEANKNLQSSNNEIWRTTAPSDYSKYGSHQNNMDLTSLHSILSRGNSSKARGKRRKAYTNGSDWKVTLAYSFIGVLAWILITLCIQEIDSTNEGGTENSRLACKLDHEVRYWASYVGLVALVTGVTIFFEKGDASQCVLVFLVNTIAFVSINQAPLSCIRNRGQMSDRDIGRVRAGFLAFLVLSVTIFWLAKKYLARHKRL